ncbi:hypothetical protein OF897_06150 [Chryseobacterium formosus]|uniref:tRNA modification GTPase n=1 Tax=Chryseobacterium formosus TaxID=1537363 RepID=A0ABT3XQ79_9FLAO|nr:hypothetical protein [Chryseobacterium formosus]MCX8523498.1 hypothetical protein [Chryseobacterium formosus]
MKGIILGSFLVSFLQINGQIKYQKGYITDFNSVKTEVLIKNLDWFNSPTTFTYKKNENSTEQQGSSSLTKEFEIYDSGRYVAYNGWVDLSSDDISSLSEKSEPVYQNASAFLKQLVEGNINLFQYKANNTVKYFFSTSEKNTISPLIYKRYHPDGDESKIAVNNSYINQLSEIFSDNQNVYKLLKKTEYKEDDLVKVFSLYNGESNQDLTAKDNNKTVKFNLHIRPGVNFYSTNVFTNLGEQSLPQKTNYRIGVEAEILLPINKNKWSILFEPSYSIYSNSQIIESTSNSFYTLRLENLSFIDVKIGVRHHMYLNENSKFFVNASLNALRLKTSSAKSLDVDFKDEYRDIVLAELLFESPKPLSNFSLGAGYTYNNKYSVEIQYNNPGQLFPSGVNHSFKVGYTSLIIGYNLF